MLTLAVMASDVLKPEPYTLHLAYDPYAERLVVAMGGVKEQRFPRGTYCVIHPGPCPERPEGTPFSGAPNFCGAGIATGIAVCSATDNFSRATGRRLAFERAVKMLPDKAVRAGLWTAFLARWPTAGAVKP